MKLKFYCFVLASTVALNVAAQISNSVNMTTNMLFYLTAGKAPGGALQFKSDDLIYWGIVGTGTNLIWYRHFPQGNFDFHLFDKNGKEMSKTKAGLAFSGTPSKPTKKDLFSSRRFTGYMVDNKGGEFRRLFRPEEDFIITNKGVYDLEVRLRLCVIMTNNVPDTSAMLDTRNVTERGRPFADQFGVLTSPPLRVKILKE